MARVWQPEICKLPWESENGMIETRGAAVSALETHRRALRGWVGGGVTSALRLGSCGRWPAKLQTKQPRAAAFIPS